MPANLLQIADGDSVERRRPQNVQRMVWDKGGIQLHGGPAHTRLQKSQIDGSACC